MIKSCRKCIYNIDAESRRYTSSVQGHSLNVGLPEDKGMFWVLLNAKKLIESLINKLKDHGYE